MGFAKEQVHHGEKFEYINRTWNGQSKIYIFFALKTLALAKLEKGGVSQFPAYVCNATVFGFVNFDCS